MQISMLSLRHILRENEGQIWQKIFKVKSARKIYDGRKAKVEKENKLPFIFQKGNLTQETDQYFSKIRLSAEQIGRVKRLDQLPKDIQWIESSTKCFVQETKRDL